MGTIQPLVQEVLGFCHGGKEAGDLNLTTLFLLLLKLSVTDWRWISSQPMFLHFLDRDETMNVMRWNCQLHALA